MFRAKIEFYARSQPVFKYILDDDLFGFRGCDDRLLLRLACNLVGPETRVVQDITELVGAG